MKPIAIFFHCLFVSGNPPDLLLKAFDVVDEQVEQLNLSGLLDAASDFVVGINGGRESDGYAHISIPANARRVMHGLESKSENLTIVEIEKWIPSHPDWYVLYIHSKGATKTDPYWINQSDLWRRCMMRHLVLNWRKCISDLERGYESVGCHWLRGMGSDHSQNYWGGNFWWAKSNFLRTLPSIYERGRIKTSGISSLESRYEAEVWIGNGPRLPMVRDYHPVNPSIRNACVNQF